jgi:phosphotransferase system IIA component
MGAAGACIVFTDMKTIGMHTELENDNLLSAGVDIIKSEGLSSMYVVVITNKHF